MKSVILGLILVLAASPAFASGKCRNGNCKVQKTQVTVTKVYSLPTLGKHSPCKDGKCRLSK